MKRTIGVALCVLGVLLAIFGIIWITVIWPSRARIPADLEQQVDLQGTVTLYENGAYVSYDVTGHRKYTAVEATRAIVYLNEDIWFDLADTDPPQEETSLRQNFLLGIDRVTRKNVPGHGDGDRDGNYSFPFNVSKTETYPFWNEGNPENLNCVYIGDPEGEEDLNGLHVYVFRMETPPEGLLLPAGFLPPDLQDYVPAMYIHQEVTLKVEPVSGVTVYFESTTKRSGKIPVPDELFPATGSLTYKDVTFYEDSLTFTQDTIDDLVSQAKSAKSLIALAKVLPWLSIGGGILLVGVGIFPAGMVGFLFPGERGGKVHRTQHLLFPWPRP